MRTVCTTCLVLVGLVAVHGSPFVGNLFSGISNVGQNLVDSGTSAVKGAVKLGVDTTKGAVTSVNNVGEKSLEGAASVGKNVLGLLGMVGGKLGPIGKPIEAVEEIGNQVIGVGVDVGKKAISLSGSLADTATDAANKLADITSDAIKDGAKAGTQLAQNWIDMFLEQLRHLLSLFVK